MAAFNDFFFAACIIDVVYRILLKISPSEYSPIPIYPHPNIPPITAQKVAEYNPIRI